MVNVDNAVDSAAVWSMPDIGTIDERIDKCVEYVVEVYVNAGGNEVDADREHTRNVLFGIYDREGEEALNDFMKNWKPHVKKRESWVGYCDYVES